MHRNKAKGYGREVVDFEKLCGVKTRFGGRRGESRGKNVIVARERITTTQRETADEKDAFVEGNAFANRHGKAPSRRIKRTITKNPDT